MRLPKIDVLDLTGVRVLVDEEGACVTKDDPAELGGYRIAGIWYRDGSGGLFDNKLGGSEPWTRERAEAALREAVQ